MCRPVSCDKCGLTTWVGCGLHIEAALRNVAIQDRCSGWETGVCNKNKEPMSELIEQSLRKGFQDDIHFLEVKDVSGGAESKFSLIVSLSKGFDGVKLVERHRMINGKDGALADIMDNIHALEMKTWTKDQFEQKKSSL